MLRLAVVVAGDGARADVDVGADRRRRRGTTGGSTFEPGAERRLLQLDEVADLGALAHRPSRAGGERRADRRAICNPRTNDHAEVVDRARDRRSPSRRCGRAPGSRRPTRSASRPSMTTPGMDHRVGADLHVGIDVGRGRVDERDAGGHQFFVLLLSHEPAHLRQFRPAVDAADLLRVRRRPAFRPAASAGGRCRRDRSGRTRPARSATAMPRSASNSGARSKA